MNDRPVLENSEVEVTPEMIEAGIKALARFNSEFDSEEDAVIWVYEAMSAVSPLHS